MAAEPVPVELPPRYYLGNFLSLCDVVESQYGDLLEPEEARFVCTFRALPEPAQCLYLRLTSRVGPWFRSRRLNYAEIGDAGPVLEQLAGAGLVVAAQALDVDALARLFTVAELRAMYADQATIPARGTKPELLAALDELALEEAAIAQRAQDWDGAPIVAPLGDEYVALLQLLFFGNRRQDLTEFVLSDLGVFRYVSYPLDRSQRLFPDRDAIEEYRLCGELSDLYYLWREAPEPDTLVELASLIAAAPFVHEASRRRWFRLSNNVARDLERLEQWDHATALYRDSELHPARERLARVFEQLEDWSQAENTCLAILENPWCEAEQEAAGKILQRVRRKARGERTPRVRSAFDERQLSVERISGSVERDTAAQLSGEWGSVHYVENGLFNGLFGLAYWDVIFAPVRGAFNNPFQSAPADMYEQGFQQRRSALVGTRRAELAECDLAAELQGVAGRNRGLQNRWVNWQLLDDELLASALACIPRAHLLAVWDRILFDPGENRRGFPDLVAFDVRRSRYQMIEVKGPGDALQDSQKRWLNFFVREGLPACVAWVSWADD